MNNFRLFWAIVKRCHFEKFLFGFIICFFASAAIICYVEKDFGHYGDALWYTFVACTTIGFGDLVSISFVGRAVTVFITLYEIVLVAILSGVVVSLYLEVIHRREKITATVFMDKMEHLTDLSQEELKELEEKARSISIHENNW